jgi:hypothetical protein
MTEIFDNIREIYDFYLPCEPLRNFIDFFSESSPQRTERLAAGRPFSVGMFPSWTPTFWVNLGASYRLATGQGSHQIGPADDIVVVRDMTVTRYNHPTDRLFTVKFFPGGLQSILGIDQTRFIDRVVALGDILPASLLRELRLAAAPEHRIALLEHYFLSPLNRRHQKDHYSRLIRDSIGTYQDEGLRPNTSQLAEKIFVHSKTINRYFNRVIGVPPKKYFATLRARTALTGYLADRAGFSPETFGYYDRSHFYKSIRQFTGRRFGSQA